MPVLETTRLRLRPWREDDLAPFAAMNGDPEVMRFFPKVLDRAENEAAIARFINAASADGFSFQPIEERETGVFLGVAGISRVTFNAPFTPTVETGWRLGRDAWGRGYASEAARAWLAYGFATLGLPEIVALAVPGNERSRAVMTRIGMTHDAGADFDHPKLPADSPLRRHVLYRIAAADFVSG